MSTMAPAAPRAAQPGPNSEKTRYDHGLLRIRENTLVVGNSIYPIANISTVSFSDLRTPVPMIVWITLALGLLCLPFGDAATAVGVILLGVAFSFWISHESSKSATDYALSVRMNAGNTAVVASNDGAFLKAIALELYDVIELEKPSNTTFNIAQKVRIDTAHGPVRITGIQGDIVNNVPGS